MLSPLVLRQLELRHGWSGEFAEQIYPYYLATLHGLAAGRSIPVFQVVDDMWHVHILCTRDYANFCAREFGRFVHHEPWANEPEETPNNFDFLGRYGLSIQGLGKICATQFEPGLPAWARLATCGQPAPQMLAPCGQDEPQRLLPNAGHGPARQG